MTYQGGSHTFVVCAYKESPYLAECVKSLLRQTVHSHIIMTTSTPNKHIKEVAARYHIPLVVNDAPSGIASDWNYAYSQARTPLVTIAHQDDIYDADFLECTLASFSKAKCPILAHTAYYEIRNGKKVYSNRLLRVKKLLLMPLIPSFTWNSRFLRRRSLSLGCGICCPSVTYVKNQLPKEPFEEKYRASIDWQTWERYSKQKGAFCYVSKPKMGHRIHEESETSKVIGDGNGRTGEDYELFRKFWPAPIARLLVRLYAKGQKSNDL
ncbi:MAG: glycosyltransferase family A protein [Eubacteriales bacterium]|nr:glycosyltransferase family A protein [Eubacteriales bacterium]